MKENQTSTDLTKEDYQFLERCLELAEEAYLAGDEPFGSILVNRQGQIIAEERNRVNERNALAHPEYDLAEWAAEHLAPEERKQTKMYTSGEHCPMCATAHGLVGLGELVFLSSGTQRTTWLQEEGAVESFIEYIPSVKILKSTTIKGPGEGKLLNKIKELQIKAYHRNK